MTYRPSPIQILALISLLLGLVITAQAADEDRGNLDMTCGPRCVQFILHRYGQQADLIALVKEAQWPELEAGASLDRLAKCLNDRGIHTAAVRLPPGREFRWPHPILLHTEEGSPARGHYVVRVPGDTPDREDRVWSGAEGWRVGRWREISAGFTGLALLTSPEPITDVNAALGPLPLENWVGIAGLAVAGATVAHLASRLARRRTKFS